MQTQLCKSNNAEFFWHRIKNIYAVSQKSNPQLGLWLGVRIFLYLCHALEGDAGYCCSPQIGIGNHYGLDYSHRCGAVRSGIRILSRQDQRPSRTALLGMVGGLPHFLFAQRCAAGKSHQDTAHQHGLSRLDGHRSRRNGAGRHHLFPRACHLMAAVFHHDAYRVHRRT